MWRERRHKRREDRDRKQEEERSGLEEGSYQTHWTMSGVSRHGKFDERDEELERLRKMVRDLELEARGRHRRRDRNNREGGSASEGDRYGTRSNRSSSHRHRDRSHLWESRRHRDRSHLRESHQHRDHSRSREYADRDSNSPEERRPRNAAMDAMSHTLRRAARSPFSDDIEWAPMPGKFTCPPLNSYDEKTDPMEHVNHYIQMMSLHTHNDVLICKAFPSSVGPTALRWFNGLQKGSIHSFAKLIQEVGVWFVTCSRVPQPINALLSMKMRVRETLHSYASWYWELYNEIGGGNEKIAGSTFRMRLPEDSKLR